MLNHEQLRDYLDDALDPDTKRTVEETLLLEPETLRQVLDQRRIDVGLKTLLQPSEGQERLKLSILTVLSGPPTEEIRNMVLRHTQFEPFPAPERSRHTSYGSALALVACVGLAALLLNYLMAPSAPPAVAQLNQIEGPVTVLHEIGAPETATASVALHPGDTVSVPPGSSAVINYPDGTALRLSGDTKVTLNKNSGPVPGGSTPGNSVQMSSGEVNANMGSSTHRRPLQIVTPQATISSGQGQFNLNTSTNGTHLNVNTGAAQIARPGERQSTSVPSGYFIHVAPGPGNQFQPQRSMPANARPAPPTPPQRPYQNQGMRHRRYPGQP